MLRLPFRDSRNSSQRLGKIADMTSPFPGMDPHLEEPKLCPDVHLTLLIAMRAELNASLPPSYAASADRYVWIHEPEASQRSRVIG